MQRDFHFYCIAVLANAAGFSSRDALTIAYASQYVDDSTESELMELNTEHGDMKFDPVRSAHIGLQSLDWSVQKRIYMPFHFLPSKPFRPPEQFSYMTEEGSEFALNLLDEAIKEPMDNYKRRLCRIGIAIHTYADSWSHQHFSGRRNPENNVENIEIFDEKEKKYKKLLWGNFYLDFAPQIGHAEAGLLVDQGFQKLKWKFSSREENNQYIKRDNIIEFMQASESIYNWFRKVDKINFNVPLPFSAVSSKIQNLLSIKSANLEKKCDKWRQNFGFMFNGEFYYNREKWRTEAIANNTNWDNFSPREWNQVQPFQAKNNFWDSLWVHFHRAALLQRHFVLENLP
ncbi:hypothetical protein GF312_07165 [Candidatus Poribacteria bacterium]|nr:hypothetical protein [Candidatus Poribacteria bacterium]